MESSKKTVSYQYDSAGNRSVMIDSDGGRTTYSYDALNRISSLINPQGERTTYAYDAAGRRIVKKLANGSRASITYDAVSRLTTLANLKSDNSVISKFNYQYDKAGNRTVAAENDGSRVTYLYDATYQLTGEHRTGTTPYRNTLTYDSRGNRTLNYYHYEALGSTRQLTNASETITDTYLYDAWGNLLTSSGSTVNPFTWTGKIGRVRFGRDVIARLRWPPCSLGKLLDVDSVLDARRRSWCAVNGDVFEVQKTWRNLGRFCANGSRGGGFIRSGAHRIPSSQSGWVSSA